MKSIEKLEKLDWTTNFRELGLNLDKFTGLLIVDEGDRKAEGDGAGVIARVLRVSRGVAGVLQDAFCVLGALTLQRERTVPGERSLALVRGAQMVAVLRAVKQAIEAAGKGADIRKLTDIAELYAPWPQRVTPCMSSDLRHAMERHQPCACLVCRAHFDALDVVRDGDGMPRCPVCGTAEPIVIIDHVIEIQGRDRVNSVRASVWGRPN